VTNWARRVAGDLGRDAEILIAKSASLIIEVMRARASKCFPVAQVLHQERQIFILPRMSPHKPAPRSPAVIAEHEAK
jgi:hypothetical protein